MAFTNVYGHSTNTKQHDQTTYPPKLLKTLEDELTPTLTLFFQASLKQRIIPTYWTTANVVPIFKKRRHGFRKHRSTETQLIQIIDNFAHTIDNRIQTDAILLDFQKAFDKVPHQRLLYKLKYYGISPKALNWIHSF